MKPIVPVLVLVAATACGRSAAVADGPARRVLRVCADPNNLPFSNAREEGFENRLAELVARGLEADLAYVWSPQRRGFLRTGLKEGRCDLVIGVASGIELARVTRPYYRSSYVVVRRATHPRVASLDDPALAQARIGVQLVGDDYTNTPPVHALARRGLADRIVGFTLYGDYAQDSPPADIVRAVAAGEVDVAIAWGPLAGYFARGAGVPLAIDPVAPSDDAGIPMQFAISMAVARDRADLAAELDAVLVRERPAIDAILDAYGVPRA